MPPRELRAGLAEVIKYGAIVDAPFLAWLHGHLDALLAMHGDQGARRLLQAYPVQEVPVADPGVLQDIDTPADLLA